MAMSYSHTRLVYTSVGSGTQFIDLTKGLALVNAKNCSQFKKDKPVVVHGTIRLEDAGHNVKAAKNTWVVRNACVKAAAAWRRTLRSAGIRRKGQLNTYARDCRFAFNETHSKTYGGQLGNSDSKSELIPDDVKVSYASGEYVAESSPGAGDGGEEITVYATLDLSSVAFNAQNKRAFTQTTFAVPQSGSTDVKDKPANLLGGLDDDYSNVIAEYIDSRINDAQIEDTDLDQSPSNDNDFVMMLAPGEEVADDVLDNVDDEGKWRPYTLASSQEPSQIITPDCNIAGQDTYFEAPLGLISWSPSGASKQIVIDITHMSEM